MKMLTTLIVALILIMIAGCGNHDAPEQEEKTTAELYYCPMHPEVTAMKPGVCPICHMDLVKKTQAADADSAALIISAGQEITANVSTIRVERKVLYRDIDAYSTLEIPENARKIIAAKFNGRIERLAVANTGDHIQQGQSLMSVYSPDIQKSSAELISAAALAKTDAAPQSVKLLDAARKRMLLFGLTREQIAGIESSGEAPFTIDYLSPFTGVVVKKKAVEGAYFSEGTELYEIADLSTIWNVAQVFENDVPQIAASNTASVSFVNLPGQTFSGKINFISPVVEKQSRTVQVRVALANASGKLRPMMYGTTRFHISLGSGISIPSETILFNGKTQVVWIKTGERSYQPREVKLGYKAGNEYQVLAGLSEGDEILASGGYLLDSESKLKGKTQPAGLQHSEGMDMSRNTASDKPRFLNAGDPLLKSLPVFNAVCPVLGDEVADNSPRVLYKGRLYGFCCKGCDKIFFNDPEPYLKNLSKDGRTFIGKSTE